MSVNKRECVALVAFQLPFDLNENGAAAMTAIVGISVVLLLIFSGLVMVQLSGRLINTQLRYQGQVLNTTEAGLEEGLSWFRRQSQQPVSSFNPVVDNSATPPVNDSDEPTIGIVRSFRVSSLGNVWGRYEVRKQDANNDGTVDSDEEKRGVMDVSNERQLSPGSVWRVESDGFIYVQNDPNVAYNVLPNQVILHKVMRTEIRRLAVVLPGGDAAINGAQGSSVTIGNASRVRGGNNIGIAYATATGNPTITNPSFVTGNPVQSTTTNSFTISAVFGVTEQELSGLADIDVADSTDLPDPLPAMSLIVIRGNATFDAQRPLVGSGILVVFGDLTISPGSNSNFNGLIYVKGNYSQGAPSLISGSVIGLQTIDVVGTGDFSEIDYSQTMIQQIRKQLGNYRFTRTPYIFIPGS